MAFLFAAPLAAQTGTLIGRVTDRASGQGVSTARIQVVQAGQVAAANFEGRYRMAGIAPGTYDVRVIAVGYGAERSQITIAAGQTATLDVQMSQIPYTIEDIVTTATGEQRRLELGHTIGVIRADSLASLDVVTNMSSLLQARTAGISVLPSAGSVGTGTRIRIRGANSLSLTNEPIVFIDGVKINSNPASSSLGTGGQSPSRLNDINPDEIESIEVVRDPPQPPSTEPRQPTG
jgi:hypothetical protein